MTCFNPNDYPLNGDEMGQTSAEKWIFLIWQAASLFCDNDSTDNITKMTSMHLHNVYAYMLPMLQNKSCGNKNLLVQKDASSIL